MRKRTQITVCFLALFMSQTVLAQENNCDPRLRTSSNDPQSYRPRGDRCEGLYIREVGSTTLLVASLTELFEDFDPFTKQDLLVDWTVPDVYWTASDEANIHLRAYSLKPKTYYQMDSIRPARTNSYNWSPNLLASLNLRRKDIGMVAWTSARVGNTEHDIYLPLRIKQQAGASKSRGYQLVLLPGAQLNEVFISLASVKPDGGSGSFVQKDQPLGYGFYAAERGIVISIPDLKTPGIYHLEIGATLKTGGSSTTQIWFYHHSK